VNVDQIALRDELVVPNFLEEHGTRQQLVLAAHHVFEKTELAWKKIDRTLASLCGASQEIEFQRPDTQGRTDALRRPTQQGVDPGDEFKDRKGFG